MKTLISHEAMIVIEAGVLEEALVKRFGESVMGFDRNFLPNALFGDEYYNDTCMRYYFQEDEYEDSEHLDLRQKDRIRIRNKVNSLLREEFPESEAVLIDVSW